MKKVIEIINNIKFGFKYIYNKDSSFVFFLIAATIVEAIDSVYSILILKIILDALMKGNIVSFIKISIIVFTFSLFLDVLYKFLQKRIIVLKSILIESDVNLDIFQSVKNLDLIEYDSTKKYNEIFFNLSQGFENLYNLFQNFASLVGKIISIITITTIIGYYHISFLFVITVFIIINSGLNFVMAKFNFNKTIKLMPSLRGMDYIKRIFYLKQYAGELRIYNMLDILNNKYKDYTGKRYKTTRTFTNYEIILTSLQTFFQLMMQIFIIIILAIKYIYKQLKIGDFLVVYNSLMEINSYIGSIIDTFPAFYQNSLYINELRSQLTDTTKNACTSIQNIKILELKSLDFSYENKSVLHNINLKFEIGKKYAILGKNGTGKTTLIKLIAGLFEPDKGGIFINNKLIKNKEQLILATAMNFQDHQYYALTVAENILMREISTNDEEEVWKLVKEVGLYTTVAELPLGIQTPITQEFDNSGTTFSGGEMQRLAIARTLYKNAEIMIFDEPTSALDPKSKKKINDVIFEHAANKILIYVTHDLNETTLFDEVIRIE